MEHPMPPSTAPSVTDTPARSYFPGMGQAVADRTVNRKIKDWTGRERHETWAEVAERVALGNAALLRDHTDPSVRSTEDAERLSMRHHLRQASLLMSGRHLQHGDETQPGRPQEVFTNCSTSAMRCLTYRLLLNGSGVGTAYDDALVEIADLNNMPIVVPIIEHGHADVQAGRISGYLTRRDAEHLYAGSEIVHHLVGDSREGWARAIEVLERMAFERKRDHVLLVDFSDVRPYGAPIKGMQNRPASGPGPMMKAVENLARLRDAGMEPWRAAMYADHYLAECVLVGGARRAARMATKTWRDETIFDFIAVKRGGFLWSANNSVTVDAEFRNGVTRIRDMLVEAGLFEQALDVRFHGSTPIFFDDIEDWFVAGLAADGLTDLDIHAWRVFAAVAWASYYDRTGEPGLIMVDRLTEKTDGLADYLDGSFVKFGGEDGLEEATRPLARALAQRVAAMTYKHVTNPCGEVSLLLLGGYCVIADVVPFHAQSDNDAEDAFRAATRALIRTNTMRCLYEREVKRTNRIGVGITGLHEWIFARFGLGFRDIIAEDPSGATMMDANGQTMVRPHPDAMPMWMTLARFARAVSDEAERYSAKLGLTAPHTNRTIKPAGTTSKLMGLTEGAHLPAMREYLRWVQFRNDDPLVERYRAEGYPTKKLTTYSGTTVVGFPTQPVICTLGMGDKLVTAGEATMDEQYRYLRLLETFWIRGVNEDLSLLPETGNQVSYTAKYDPAVTSFPMFVNGMIDGQFKVRCCSVMPQIDTTAFEYQPEEPVTKAQFEMIAEAIQNATVQEDVGFEHVDCAGGACPVDFKSDEPEVVSAKAEPEFVVYSIPNCGWCNKAAALLNDIGAPYRKAELLSDHQKRSFLTHRGFDRSEWTFPKIYALRNGREELIGGYDDLAALLQR
jgi:glutaredoxin